MNPIPKPENTLSITGPWALAILALAFLGLAEFIRITADTLITIVWLLVGVFK